jgi:hypothetical protein
LCGVLTAYCKATAFQCMKCHMQTAIVLLQCHSNQLVWCADCMRFLVLIGKCIPFLLQHHVEEAPNAVWVTILQIGACHVYSVL